MFSKKFTTCAISLGLIFATAVPSFAAIALKAATPANAESYVYKAYTEMGKYIEEKSNGKYKLEIYESAKLGNPDTVNQGIQFGTIHFAQEGTGNMSAFTPVANVFELPFVFGSIEDFRKIFNGPMADVVYEKMSTKTIRYLGVAEIGFRKMFVNDQVNSLAELKTKRIRTTLSKTHNAAISAMGMNATPMPMMEVFTAIQQGVVDGLDLDFFWASMFNIHEVAPYVYETDHLVTPQVLVTGERWWSSLPKKDQAMFEEAVKVFIATSNKYNEEDQKKALDVMNKANVKFIQPTAADKAAMVKSVQPLYDKLPKDQAELMKEIKAALAK